jgi:hypothetical protein
VVPEEAEADLGEHGVEVDGPDVAVEGAEPGHDLRGDDARDLVLVGERRGELVDGDGVDGERERDDVVEEEFEHR